MGFRIQSITLLAVLGLTACTTTTVPDHCIAKIDPFDLSEESYSRTCNVAVMPTTTKNSLLFIDNDAFQKALTHMLTEKATDAVNSVIHFNVVYSEDIGHAEPDANVDYILTSNIDEFILTESKNPEDPNLVGQQEITAAITYKLLNATNSTEVSTNTINVGYLNRVYDPEILKTENPATTKIANNIIDDVTNLFKYNFINELNPIRVVDIDENGVVLLSQPLPVGATCHVYYDDNYKAFSINNYLDEDLATKATL